MMVTAEEAKKIRCPLMLSHDGARQDKCFGPSCMAWRYRDHQTGPEWAVAVKKAVEELKSKNTRVTISSTQLAHEAAAHVMSNRAQYGLPVVPTHGWCGLAGKPEWWAK